ncbi:translocation/assembly module TamB domain-containing protein [Cardinium endosymbiont of Tipula unca]|uniref:translocation/assembly module TamB domain-containing protein n=1 Tax=Cardinium endosymbiont of Tipula unca TaxID=3066216 RepID=UPI0030D2F40C
MAEINKKIKKWLLNLVTRLLLFVPICFIAVIGLLHMPAIQQRLLHSLLDHLNKTTPYEIKCDSMRLTWLQHITLTGIAVADPQKQPLFSIHQLYGKLNLCSLLLLKPDMVDTLTVSDTQFCLELEEDCKQNLNITSFYTKVVLPLVPGESTDLFIKKILLNKLNLNYHCQAKQQPIVVENIHLSIENFLSSTNYNAGKISSFSYKETSSLPFVVQNLTTQFAITPNSIALNDCQLTTKYSNLQGDLKLSNTKEIASFSDKEGISLEAVLNESTLSSIDLSQFVDFFKGIDALYKLDGAISITPDSVAWKNCKLSFGKEDSCINSTGNYHSKDKNKTNNILVSKGMLHTVDLLPYLKETVSIDHPCLTKLSYIALHNAKLTGDAKKNNLIGHFSTNMGHISTDLMLEYLDNEKILGYHGKMKLDNITINSILPSLPIASISAALDIKGKGYSTQSKTLHMHVAADLIEINTPAYCHKGIKTSCVIDKGMATFHVNSKDPSATLTISGSYDFKHKNSLKIDGIIKKLNLAQITLMDHPLELSTQFCLNVGNIFDKFPMGQCLFDQLEVKQLQKKITFKKLQIDSLPSREANLFTLTSPLVDCKLKGKFTMSSLISHLRYLVDKLKYQVDRTTISTLVDVNYAIDCKNISPILDWFSFNTSVSPSTTLLGSFTYDKEYHFSLNLPKASDIRFKHLSFKRTKVNCMMQNVTNEKTRFIQLNCSSEKQNWHKKWETDHLLLQLLVKKNSFFISNNLSIPQHEGKLSLACSGTLTEDAIKMDLLPSNFTTKDKIWNIQATRPSIVSRKEIEIGNLSITSGNAAIQIEGKLGETEQEAPLYCNIHNMPFDYFLKVIEGKIHGTIDATLNIRRLKGLVTTTGKLNLKDCKLKEHEIGTFSTKIDWNSSENKLSLEGGLKKEGRVPLEIHGYYFPGKQYDNLWLTTTLNQIDMYLLNPFVTSIFSEIEGKLSGQFQLTGNFNKPVLNGKGRMDQGKFKIDFLNTLYQISGKITAKKNILHVHRLHLQDAQTGHAHFSGTLGLVSGFPLSLSGAVENLHVLQTTQPHNPDFYGSLHGTGTLQIQGPIRDLVFKAKATANKGHFTIITSSKEEIDNTSQLVRFIYKQPNNSRQKNRPIQKLDNNEPSIKLALDLTILPTVKTTVLFGSYTSNDMVKGKGIGKIQLEVGTNRKPYVVGDYVFKTGSCTISVYNLMQKKFTIMPNSQVSFSGYPQEGIARIKASYIQMASILELHPQSNDKRPIPAEISLYANGPLANPHISYGISFPVKSVDFELNNALEECASKALFDKNYLGKQILSLLVAKRVYNEKEINGWDALSNGINDLFAQQIQNWVSKIDRNLEIETDLGITQWNKRSINLLEKTKIKVSYMLLGRHLKLSTALGRSSNLINDWEIAYQFSRINNMSTKLYQHPLESGFSTVGLFGISLAYTKRFR